MNPTNPLSTAAASQYAREVDALNNYLLAVTVFFTVLISLTIVVFAIKYRRRSDADRPAPTKDGKLLEIVGSVIPFFLVMIMFFWGAHLYFKFRVPPRDAIEILVTGKQWMWKFQHPNGKREINDLRVPVGVPVKLTMTSEDVIHSLFLPAFRKKMDVVPGKYTQLWFQPEEVGTSPLFCTEYCGTEHSLMKGTLHVMPLDAYQAWVSQSGGTTVTSTDPVVAGKALYEQHCLTCHTGKRGAIGPQNLGTFGTLVPLADGSEVLVDENFLKTSMLDPNFQISKGYAPGMNTFKGVLSGSEIDQIIAYIKSTAPSTDAKTEATP